MRGSHLKFSAPAIITSRELIIARYDAILDQSEHALLYNHLVPQIASYRIKKNWKFRARFSNDVPYLTSAVIFQVYPLVWLWNIWCTLLSLAVLSNFRYSFFFGEIFQRNNMEERTKKTLEECKKLELKLTEVEQEKKNLDKKYTQVRASRHDV